MTPLLVIITLWYSGFNITIDSYSLYKIQTMEECKHQLNYIVRDMNAKRGMCSIGDILQESHEI
jgi:hypothetical protein